MIPNKFSYLSNNALRRVWVSTCRKLEQYPDDPGSDIWRKELREMRIELLTRGVVFTVLPPKEAWNE